MLQKPGIFPTPQPRGTSSRESAAKGRFVALDGLRGAAALLVMFYHVGWSNHLTFNPLVRSSYLAVDLFFILSGFVIASGYPRTLRGFAQKRDFLYLRWFRVYPLHAAVLAVFVGIEIIRLMAIHSGSALPGRAPFASPKSLPELLGNLLLVHSLGIFSSLTWNVPSWSISCEFATYVLFALGAFSWAFRSRLSLAAGLILVAAAYLGLALSRHTLDVTYDLGIVRSVCGFFLGMTLAKLSGRPLGKTVGRLPAETLSKLQAGALLLLIALALFAKGGMIVLAIPCFVVLIATLQTDRGWLARGLQSPAAQFLGRTSYSLYLVHFLLLMIFAIILKQFLHVPLAIDPVTQVSRIRINPWLGDLLILAVLAIILPLAALSYAKIEMPARLYGRRVVGGAKSIRPAQQTPL